MILDGTLFTSKKYLSFVTCTGIGKPIPSLVFNIAIDDCDSCFLITCTSWIGLISTSKVW